VALSCLIPEGFLLKKRKKQEDYGNAARLHRLLVSLLHMDLTAFQNQYSKPGTIILLEGMRVVKEADIYVQRFCCMGVLLFAEEALQMLMRN
jgi:hypothetical protein